MTRSILRSMMGWSPKILLSGFLNNKLLFEREKSRNMRCEIAIKRFWFALQFASSNSTQRFSREVKESTAIKMCIFESQIQTSRKTHYSMMIAFVCWNNSQFFLKKFSLFFPPNKSWSIRILMAIDRAISVVIKEPAAQSVCLADYSNIGRKKMRVKKWSHFFHSLYESDFFFLFTMTKWSNINSNANLPSTSTSLWRKRISIIIITTNCSNGDFFSSTPSELAHFVRCYRSSSRHFIEYSNDKAFKRSSYWAHKYLTEDALEIWAFIGATKVALPKYPDGIEVFQFDSIKL